jgi:hypothetical protein
MTYHDPRLTAVHREYGRKDAGQRADDQAEFKAVMDALAKRDAEIKSFAEKASAEIKANGTMAAETKTALEKIAGDASGLQARLMDVEQKLARRGGSSDGPATKSIGEQFTDSESFKSLQGVDKGRARLKVKAVTTITSATTGTAASATRSGRPAFRGSSPRQTARLPSATCLCRAGRTLPRSNTSRKPASRTWRRRSPKGL